ncbi:uncharacterized protein LOC110191045 [Drosophila serrata]|uniref:uncharacterized protein LOC110191045 n=1 Tax=Drosophila serrata TaxID=7274 RepID=UPI000A1D1FCC|nr:uncharacterized protein LOC110191045 [Drosophila serrata]
MHTCRLCLAKDANFPTVNTKAAMRIMACLSIEIDPGDGLPQHICTICRLRLEEINSFRRRCLAVDRRLKRRNLLQHHEPKAHMEVIAAQEEAEEERILQDVVGCTATACSENNAQWRQQASKVIRAELDAYKKELHAICKQAVRGEIENEIRAEMMGVLMAEAKQKLKLSVLDELFDELEAFFVRKRNEAAYGSESFCTNSPQKDGAHSDGFFEAEEQEELVSGDVVELLDDEPEPRNPEPRQPPTTAEKTHPAPPTNSFNPMPMVEINMSDSQMSHLREDFNREAFLRAKTTPRKNVKVNSPRVKRRRISVLLCRKHNDRTKRYSQEPVDSSECVCCRLRGAHKLNQTAS